MKNICILGSTGSIGTQALDVISNLKDYNVVALSCNNNISLFEKQIRIFKPKIVCVFNEEKANELKIKIKDLDTVVLSKEEGLIEIASYYENDIVLTAIVGMIGIKPTIAAIKSGKDIALANKETLVCAGKIITELAKKHNVKILPVDSEHSAIFQCISVNNEIKPKNVILTASGGAFRGKKKEDLQDIKLEDALKHPTWDMGVKVTIDSATLANKGLEVIEAKWLFNLNPSDIKVVIHPQSIVHSMVEYEDGAIIAQLGITDMRLPIQYALTYPNRLPMNNKLDIYNLNKLEFLKPDVKTFSALNLATSSLKKGGNMPAVFNIANEVAVELFIKNKIKFLQISEIIEKELTENKFLNDFDVDYLYNIKEEIFYKYFK